MALSDPPDGLSVRDAVTTSIGDLVVLMPNGELGYQVAIQRSREHHAIGRPDVLESFSDLDAARKYVEWARADPDAAQMESVL